MGNFFTGVVVGAFLGALTVEILARTNPDLLDRVRERARAAGGHVGEALGDKGMGPVTS